MKTNDPNSPANVLMRMGAARGGKARAEAMTPEQRREQSKQAIAARWSGDSEKKKSIQRLKRDAGIAYNRTADLYSGAHEQEMIAAERLTRLVDVIGVDPIARGTGMHPVTIEAIMKSKVSAGVDVSRRLAKWLAETV